MEERTIRVLAVGPAPAFEGEDVETERVEEIQTALDRLAQGGIDVDIVPLALGAEAIAAVREAAPDVPLVAVADHADGLAALEAGAHDYVGPDADPATSGGWSGTRRPCTDSRASSIAGKSPTN